MKTDNESNSDNKMWWDDLKEKVQVLFESSLDN